MNILLPIKTPPVKTLPQIAYPASILFSYDICHSWIFNNYIQIITESGINYDGNFEVYFDYLVPQPEYHYNPWFYSYSQRINRTLLNKTGQIIEFIKDSIFNGFYVWLFVNEYYIPNTNTYKKFNFPHGILLYGFNDLEQRFYIAGFFNNPRKFSFSTVTYNEFEQAYHALETESETMHLVHLLKINPQGHNGVKFDFDCKFLSDTINDFINSTNTTQAPLRVRCGAFKETDENSTYYGLNSYLSLKKYLELDYYDYRPYHLIHEHKKLMLMRISFLRDRSIFISDSIYNSYKDMEMQSTMLLNLVLKLRITQNKKLIDNIIKKIDLITSIERDTLKEMYKQLIEYC